MKSKIFNRKTVALLAAVGLTAGLLTPVTTNITFAQDNGIKIGTRTPGDAGEELSDILDYNDYAGNDQQFITDIEEVLSEYTYITLYNVPEGYSFNLSNEDEEWLYPSFDIYVGGYWPEAKYEFQANYDSTNEIQFVLPSFEDFYSTYDETIEGMVVEGTKYVAFDMPDEFTSHDNTWFSADINCSYLDLSFLGDTIFEHSYTISNGISSVLKTYPDTRVWLSSNEYNSKTFFANQCYDGSAEVKNTISINTRDAQEDNYLEEVRDTVRNNPDVDVFSYPAGPEQNNIPAAFFEVFKEENKGISFDMDYTKGFSYSLIFNQIDTAMDFNPQATVTETEINGAKAFVFDFEHNGALPGTMTVRAFVGVENNAPTAYLYYVNEDGTLEKMESGAKLELGYAEFTIDHCSSYVVSTEDLTESTVPENPGDSGNEEEQPPVQTPDDNTDVDLTDKDPADTGASTAASALMSMIVLSGAFAGIAGIMRHKAKS